MKQQIFAHIKQMHGTCEFSGKWPATFYISAVDKQTIIDALFKRFGRHTKFRFL